MSFETKTTDEVVQMFYDWAGLRPTASKTLDHCAGAKTMQDKLQIMLEHTTTRRKPPQALCAWLEEALERERKNDG